MTMFELLSWLFLGAALGVLVAAFWRTEGLTWGRALALGMFGGMIGGLIGRILFLGPSSGEMGFVAPALAVAGVGAVVLVLIARSQLRNAERPRFS
jgi:uncharacterized membrane protein YeaQ/YmgE (transglycosylase-associated protein family)